MVGADPVEPAGLVPCGDSDTGESLCQTCDIYRLVENVFGWIFGLAAVVAAIIIVVGGMRMVTSAGNQMAKADARKWIGSAVVGFVLIMSAWILVELLIGVLYGSDEPGSIWEPLQCVAQPNDP